MKRLIVLMAVLILIIMNVGYTAAPALNSIQLQIADTVTVNRQLSNTDATMQVLTNENVVLMTDTCLLIATVTGIAIMDPYDKLYIGFRSITTNDSVCDDTTLIQAPYGASGQSRIPFTIRFIDSLISQTDRADTLSVNAACGGSSGGEAVQLENVLMTVEIIDIDGH